MEQKLKERFIEKYPEASDHSVHLEGYGIVMVNNVGETKPHSTFKFEMVTRAKNGRELIKRSKGSLFFTYCPYCGTKV